MAQAEAQHPDGTRRGISYSLFSGNRKKAFTINSFTGNTKLLLQPDEFERKSFISKPICVSQVKSGFRARRGWILRTPPDYDS